MKSDNSIKKTKKTKSYSLVYFGAGWDFKPTNDPVYKKFNHFIFIDSLPKMSHYEPGMPGYEKSKDREAFINTLKNTALDHGMILCSIRKNLLTFKNDHQKLEYYINTTVLDALTNKIIRNKLNRVIWVHENGFRPYDYGLNIGDLPNLLEYRAKIHEL